MKNNVLTSLLALGVTTLFFASCSKPEFGPLTRACGGALRGTPAQNRLQ